MRKKVWTGCGNVLSDPWKRGERLFQMGDGDRKIQIKLGLEQVIPIKQGIVEKVCPDFPPSVEKIVKV